MRTQLPATASTPGSHCLPSLERLAKSKSDQINAFARKLGQNGSEISLTGSVTGAASLVLAAGGSHAASDNGNSSIPTVLNGLAMLAPALWYQSGARR
jgi:hypothetical protein